MQYPTPAQPEPWGLPTGTDWATWNGGWAAVDGQVVAVLGSRGKQGHIHQIRAAIRGASGAWRDVLVDPGTNVRGPGAYTSQTSFSGTAIATSPRGYVAIGNEDISDAGHLSISRLGFSWFSTDGTHWTRTDMRSIAGKDAAFVPASVMATPDGWLMVGSQSSRNLSARAVIVTLASTDGVHWRKISQISGKWALIAGRLATMGDRIVLAGNEWACSRGGYELNAAIGNPQLRLWISGDGGKTWTAGDGTAGGINSPTNPTPTSAKGCTKGIGAYSTPGSYLGIVNGRAVVISSDHAKVATSTDLVTWQAGDLPGAVPTGEKPYASGGTLGSVAATPDGSGVVILSLETRRNPDDSVASFGAQVLGWNSPDGATWTRLPATRPIEALAEATLIPSPDGSVYLLNRKAYGGPGTYLQSTAGPLVATVPCVPGPKADCAYSTVDSVPPGTDMSGINLYGAEIAGTADLSNIKLTGAKLTGATIDDAADLTGADLSRADLTGARIGAGVKLSGAKLVGANLRNAYVGVTDAPGLDLSKAKLENTDLSSMDLSQVTLTGATFTYAIVNTTFLAAKTTGVHIDALLISVGPAGSPDDLARHDFGAANLTRFYFGGTFSSPGDLAGASFRRAKIGGLSFGNVDLTGATFPPGAKSMLDFSGAHPGIYFGAGVTCPDGKPASGAKAPFDCRLH